MSRLTHAVSSCTASTDGSARTSAARLSRFAAFVYAAAGRTTIVCGSGFSFSASIASPKPESRRNSFSASSAGISCDVGHIAPLTDALGRAPRFLRRRRSLEEHREIDCAIPVAGRGLRVRDQQMQARRQRERDADDQDRQQRRELVLRQPAERADRASADAAVSQAVTASLPDLRRGACADRAASRRRVGAALRRCVRLRAARGAPGNAPAGRCRGSRPAP